MISARKDDSKAYLQHQPPQISKETHQVPCIRRHNVREIAADIIRRSAHRGLDSIASSVHKKFCKPFQHHLDLLRIWLDQIGSREWDANVVNTTCNFFIGLGFDVSRWYDGNS